MVNMIVNVATLKKVPYRLRKFVDLKVRAKLNGVDMIIPAQLDDGVENAFWTRSWKTEIIERYVDPEQGAFIDVGANVGQTLLDLRLVKPNVTYVGFEPNVVCVNYLHQLIQLNRLRNCQIVPVGLAEKTSCRVFFRHAGAQADSRGSIIAELRPDRAFETDVVPCFRFDEVCKDLNLDKIGFIKIDVEGAELEALAGMQESIKKSRPFILCEVLFTDSKADLSVSAERNGQLMGLMTTAGYGVYQIIKSSDTHRVIELRRIDEFESTYWTVENRELCDYLFIPDEKRAAANFHA